MKNCLLLLFLVIAGSHQRAWAQSNSYNPQLTANATAASSTDQSNQVIEDEKISHLINYLRHLPNAIFIRNGSEFSPEKAADHLQSKWDKHKKKIKTAHDFIDKLASFSKTKEPYQIRFSDGSTVPCGEVLNKELARMESSNPVSGTRNGDD